jgi:hypothetical protein
MKFLYTLFAFLITLNLAGQVNFKPAEDIISKYAQYWAEPSHSFHVNERGLLLAPTHKLDSVLTKEENGVVSFRAEVDYNDLGHTTQMRQYELDSATFNLTLYNVFTFEYEIPGYPSHILSETFDPATQQLVPDLEMDITYDGSNRVDSVVVSLEDPLFGGGFGPFIAVKQVYSGQLLVQTRQWIYISLLGGWLPSNITDFSYNPNDVLVEQISATVDFSTGELTPDARTTYEYNAEGLRQNVTLYYWNESFWDPNQQNYFEYYGNGTLSSETRLFYNPTTAEWENNTLTVYPVETVDFEFPVTSYFWDAISATWFETDSVISLLNPSLKWADVAAPTQISILTVLSGGEAVNNFDPEGSSIEETRYFLVDSLSGAFYHDYTDEYYYSLFEGSSVSPVLPGYLSVFPNPAQNQFTIDLDIDAEAGYTVYTSTGATLVKGDMHEGRNKIQTSSWLPGIYYVVIRMQDGEAYVHKQMVD